MKQKLSTIAAILLFVATLGSIACSNGNDTTGPDLSFEPAQVSTGSSGSGSGGTSGGGGTVGDQPSSGNVYTIINGADVANRADCGRNQPGWFLPSGYDIRVRLDQRLEDNWRYVSNLFWAPEPNCQPTNSQGGRGTSTERAGKFLDASFRPEKACGRYQWDLLLKNETTGESFPIFYAVLNTGKESCEPPPPPQNPGCPANARNEISAEPIQGEGRYCYRISYSSDQPGPYEVFDNGQLIDSGKQSDSVDRCYNEPDETHEYRFKAGKCDPTTSITTPPAGCEDFEPPALNITGSPSVNESENKVTVGQGSIGPDGVTFSTTLPFDVQRPEYGQSAASWEFTAYLEQKYGPDNLECVARTSKEFSGKVEPKRPTCEQANPPNHGGISINAPISSEQKCEDNVVGYLYTYENGTGDGDAERRTVCESFSGIFSNGGGANDSTGDTCVFPDFKGDNFNPSWPGSDDPKFDFSRKVVDGQTCETLYTRSNPITCSVNVESTGNWNLVMKAWDPGSYTKDEDPKTLECGGEGQLNVTYNWKGHGSRYWQCQLFLNGTKVAETAVIDGH